MSNYYRFIPNSNITWLSYNSGNSTRNISETPVLNRPTLKYGDQGEYVTLLQTQLKQLTFYNGNIDGNFDDETLESVRGFQANNNLTVNGIVDNNTWSALIYLYAPLAICETNTYIVQSGDTLWNIARKYNTTVDELKSLNNLSTNLLTIGQKIIVPSIGEEAPNNVVYVVQRGDTLWSIANKFNTTVNAIKNLNNLTSNTLSIGQQLNIPGIQNAVTYVVQRGDTLWSIANKFNTTVLEIKTLNNLTSNLLNIGQTLKIPS